MPPTQAQATQARPRPAPQAATSDAAKPAPKTGDAAGDSTQSPALPGTLTSLRSKLLDLDKDNWVYEAPRYTYR